MSIVLTVLGVIVVLLLATLAITGSERREGRNLPIAQIDFASVPDGTYRGAYAGGKYKMRANEVRVTVQSGKVTDIDVVSSKNPPGQELTDKLFDSVIEKQSLQVDTVSGATITSKSYLKSVENALAKAGS